MVESGCQTQVGAEAEGQPFNTRDWAGSKLAEKMREAGWRPAGHVPCGGGTPSMPAFHSGEGDVVGVVTLSMGLQPRGRCRPMESVRGVKRTNRCSVWAGGMPKALLTDCLASLSFVHVAFLSDETGGSLRMGAMSS